MIYWSIPSSLPGPTSLLPHHLSAATAGSLPLLSLTPAHSGCFFRIRSSTSFLASPAALCAAVQPSLSCREAGSGQGWQVQVHCTAPAVQGPLLHPTRPPPHPCGPLQQELDTWKCTVYQGQVLEMKFYWKGGELNWFCLKYTWEHQISCTWVETGLLYKDCWQEMCSALR